MIRAHHSFHLLSPYDMSELMIRSCTKSSATNTSILLMRKPRLRGINLFTQGGNIGDTQPQTYLTPNSKMFVFPNQSPQRCQQEGSDKLLAHPLR